MLTCHFQKMVRLQPSLLIFLTPLVFDVETAKTSEVRIKFTLADFDELSVPPFSVSPE